ncbi:MAG: Multidrug resistance protein NorM [Phycisphaerales bacterium]|nr:Multidrug resistance protein NorM [Phycisphaerales bacterium]
MEQPTGDNLPAARVLPGVDMPDAEAAADAQASAAAAASALTADDRPLRDMLRIAAPVVVAMTSFTVMQAVDKLMVSRIGPDPIYVGAQGNGGLASWVPLSIVVGTINVINTYVSQNLGNKTPERAPQYAWSGVWIAVLAWLPLLLYAALMEPMFLWLGHDPARAAMEASYGRPLVIASVITLSARGFSQFFYGMHMPGVVLVAELGANLTNFVLNSIFIYGPVAPAASGIGVLDGWYGLTSSTAQSLGIPRMGVRGAAMGTVCATVVELAIPMAVFLSPRFNRLYNTRAAWKPSLKPIKDILRIGWPGGLMFGNEMICWGFFMVYLVGEFGEFHSNAGWIAHQWMSLSFMPAVGISVAITAVVGKCMGARRPDLAARRAWLGLALAAGYMATMGLLFVVFREPMVRFFISGQTPPDDARQIIEVGTSFMIAAATFQLFDGIAMSLSGALRGAGDTVWVGVVTVVLSWTVIVGGGLALVRFAPSLGSVGPWIAASAYIVLLAVVCLYRFLSGEWKHIRLVDPLGGVAHG